MPRKRVLRHHTTRLAGVDGKFLRHCRKRVKRDDNLGRNAISLTDGHKSTQGLSGRTTSGGLREELL